MAVKVNGARIEFDGYDYARVVKGEAVETGKIDELRARKKALGLKGRIMFRAKYITDWIPASESPND